MSWLVSLITGPLINSILAPVLGYFTAKQNADLQAFTTGAAVDKDIQIAAINSQVEIAQLQASVNTWWGARLIILIVAGACAYHFSAVMLDSVPWWGHVVGSWRVPRLPEPYDGYEGKILLSFFIITPAAPVFSAIAAWFHRK